MAVEFAQFTEEEQEIVDAIIDRALRMFREAGVLRRRVDVRMDLSAVHAKTPLRLAALLEADDFNFAHDLAGIARHLNRETGELENCFLPRFTRPVRRSEEA